MVFDYYTGEEVVYVSFDELLDLIVSDKDLTMKEKEEYKAIMSYSFKK